MTEPCPGPMELGHDFPGPCDVGMTPADPGAMDDEDWLELYPLGDCAGPSVAMGNDALDWTGDSYPYPPSWPAFPTKAEYFSKWKPMTQDEFDMARLTIPRNAFEFFRKQITGGLDGQWETIQEMVNDLPHHCRSDASNILGQVVGTPGMTPMTGASSPADYLAKKLQMAKAVYVGITERPVERFVEHNELGYSQMALWSFASSSESASKEKYFKAKYRSDPLLQNIGSGGERASEAQPHFLYIVS